MANSAKKSKKVICSGCGTCCREPIVPVTHKDISRLSCFVNKAPGDFVRFYPTSLMDYDPQSPMWVRLKSGKRAMGLKRVKNRCIFLDDTNRCSVYRVRPMTCRNFPYDVDLEENTENNIQIGLNHIVKCNARFCSDTDFSDILTLARQEMREDLQYHTLVKRWNSRRKRGDATEFLSFIELE